MKPETELAGMDKLAPKVGRLSPIDLIADHRKADGGKVNSYLMGAPRLQGNFDEGIAIQILDNPILGARLPALGYNRHPLSVAGVAPDGSIDDRPLRGEMPLDQYQVSL
jgi:hypothetical protein